MDFSEIIDQGLKALGVIILWQLFLIALFDKGRTIAIEWYIFEEKMVDTQTGNVWEKVNNISNYTKRIYRR
ncbi:hypothetical protein [Vibrio phage RYC]|nr:hypothetical protein [Vibrio phage RYC]